MKYQFLLLRAIEKETCKEASNINTYVSRKKEMKYFAAFSVEETKFVWSNKGSSCLNGKVRK